MARSKKVIIEIKLDNAAFLPCDGDETARLLRVLADLIEGCYSEIGNSRKLHDTSGNPVLIMNVVEA